MQKPLSSAAAGLGGFVLAGIFPKPMERRKLSAATRFFGIAETIALSMAHFYTGSAPMYPVLVLLPAFDAGSFYVIAFPDKDSVPENPTRWYESTVVKILERREYTGCVVNFKTYTNSIWDQTKRQNPTEKQAVFYGIHEPIIDIDAFDKVQQIRQQRHRRTKTGKTSLFSGLVYCSDCGEKMYYCTTKDFEKRQDFFECSVHHKHKEDCKTHFIRAVVLEKMVWQYMEVVLSYVLQYEDHFRRKLQEKLQMEGEEKLRAQRQQLVKAQKRIADLDRLFIRIYEDNTSGKLSDDKFSMMSQAYEAEQEQLEEEVAQLQQELEVQEQQNENIEQFIRKVHKYEDLTGLTSRSLRDLVSGIYVSTPDKSTGKRRQSIHIKYDGIGFIPLDELMERETA